VLLTGRSADWNVRKGAAWWFSSRGADVVLRAVIGPDLA
jgi:hypothetical protein